MGQLLLGFRLAGLQLMMEGVRTQDRIKGVVREATKLDSTATFS